MSQFKAYSNVSELPTSQAGRVGRLLGLKEADGIDDLRLAEEVALGLKVSAADSMINLIGRNMVVNSLIPEATLRRAREKNKLSKEMSERLYEVSRVIDEVSRIYHGDQKAITEFLTSPHPLLDGKTPMDMARSSSAGADAVINMLKRAEYSFAL